MAQRTFEVWAPRPSSVVLWVDGTEHPMAPAGGGWWAVVAEAAPGARYGFILDGEETVLPDPRSPRQPDGVHSPSQVWSAPVAPPRWAGRELHHSVVYELHVGTFTPDGTFDAAIERLDHLAALGVGFVELMPVNAVNGVHNWGYDGVGWYAVHEPYGGPDALLRLIAAAHERGLGVLIDAVYNHLGPSGNYLGRFGPYETDGTNTWGRTINIAGPDSDEVREFVIESALRWMRDFGADGLRLDAVHALADTTAVHLLEELATRTEALATDLGRPLALVAESDLNDPRLVTPRDRGGYGLAAQWDDDVHHAIHAIVSGERQGYYADFGSAECLSKVLREGFFHAGTYSSFRRRRHGRPLDRDIVDGGRLLAYTCTHDQIGNRATGDRPAAYLTPGQLVVKAALVLFSPFTPMLFMGEEWGATTPFQFFTSHPEPELARRTAEGRVAEFVQHGWPPGDVPDPQDPVTFEASKLDWSQRERQPHARVLAAYRDLLAFREGRPGILDGDLRMLTTEYPDDESWFAVHRGDFTLLVTFTPDGARIPIGGDPVLWWDEPETSGNSTTLPGHSFAILRTR
ncbi:malto-oligosyltrehalose trehalohydrolase [Tsukamurella sp. 8F]|uniref:malto-oligosyltrehalose trehalohydrolase n=1 Tax=unclassified Tsukamurella TaxID=2633480 RepID=UPI0023B9F6EE|nr:MULTISPECIES: malto-oligosyltrehalose trehalohydrolase [unclassified Tsukamurella]MDF0529186.1 malto-oligosyltrehalose trehalohydrolase [Tsukamurella sp. 8J]MDF0585371.1 malto-oligosyltrehalose trehalohydrolase [Tsukamurella sp. 8F]